MWRRRDERSDWSYWPDGAQASVPRHAGFFAVHDRVRAVRVTQVMKARVRYDSGGVARFGPESPKVIRTQRLVSLLARKHPLPGRRSGKSMQQLPRGFAKQNVPRSRLRVNQGQAVGLDLAPAQTAYLLWPASRQQEQTHRRDADRVVVLALAQDSTEPCKVVGAEEPPARRSPVSHTRRIVDLGRAMPARARCWLPMPRASVRLSTPGVPERVASIW